MLQLRSLNKRYGTQILLENVSLALTSGERLALFGRNGSGKSTLLKVISGDEHADSGDVITPKGYRIGYLRQQLVFTRPTVLEEACIDLEDYEEYRAKEVLEGLGFSAIDMDRSPSLLSGGFQIRLNLAKLMLAEPNLLLLDEPTNYLDIVSVRWLERYLRAWRGELIVISHDRDFCDTVGTHSALIYRRGIRKYAGSSAELFERIAEDEEVYERSRQNQLKERQRIEKFINRFRAKASKAVQVQSRVKALERMGSLSELEDEQNLEFSFRAAPFPGRFILEAQNLRFAYPGNDRPLIDGLSVSLRHGDRLAVIGKNGRGKSTLLRLLASELKPLSGEVVLSTNTRPAFFGQTNIDRLDANRTVVDEIRVVDPALSHTSVRTICGIMMFEGDQALKKVKVLSGGERSRVLLGKVLAQEANLLLLDEPTNHLDVESVEALLQALERFPGTVIIVTHQEEIIRRLASRLIVFESAGPVLFEGDYDLFLKTRGWEEEKPDPPSTSASTTVATQSQPEPPAKGKSGDRRERAAQVQTRSQTLNPLKKKITGLERDIARSESEQRAIEAALAEASAQGNSAAIVDLSKKLQKEQEQLEALLQEWETTEKQLQAVLQELG